LSKLFLKSEKSKDLDFSLHFFPSTTTPDEE